MSLLTFDEARARVLALGGLRGRERVGLGEAHGRVLAENVVAPDALPAFDHSMMDGYAVATSAFAQAGPTTLPVHGEARAGGRPGELVPGTACRIFTGAPMPHGADAVVMQEHVTRIGDAATFAVAPAPGSHFRRRGEDLAAGAIALAAGTRLAPAHIALAATVDRAWLLVARRPIVTFVATGDELRAPGTAGAPGTIADSNTLALAAAATNAGALVRIAPAVGDDARATEEAFAAAFVGTDVLVTVGGASVGDHDLVKPSLEAVGATIDFHKIAMKPGKPLMVGRRGDALVVGLPGNPISALVTFALFGLPLLRALQGETVVLPTPRRARLATKIERSPGRVEFLRATLVTEGNHLVATPLRNQASNALPAFARAEALVIVPADAALLEPGDPVDVLPLRDLGL